MHTRIQDLARTAACWQEPAAPDDARHVSALVWIVPLVCFWVAVGLAVV
jgi:hypothetical protein